MDKIRKLLQLLETRLFVHARTDRNKTSGYINQHLLALEIMKAALLTKNARLYVCTVRSPEYDIRKCCKLVKGEDRASFEENKREVIRLWYLLGK